MAYTKTFSGKILRIKHKIDIHVGMPSLDLKDILKFVPDNACVDEITEEFIEFHEERLENKE